MICIHIHIYIYIYIYRICDAYIRTGDTYMHRGDAYVRTGDAYMRTGDTYMLTGDAYMAVCAYMLSSVFICTYFKYRDQISPPLSRMLVSILVIWFYTVGYISRPHVPIK